MRPLIKSLCALNEEIGNIEDIDISPAEAGHMATVRIGNNERYSISTSYDNTTFKVEEHHTYIFPEYDTTEKEHQLKTPDLVLSLIVGAVGKYIASKQVLAERK
jgi:hypothetical protein